MSLCIALTIRGAASTATLPEYAAGESGLFADAVAAFIAQHDHAMLTARLNAVYGSSAEPPDLPLARLQVRVPAGLRLCRDALCSAGDQLRTSEARSSAVERQSS